MITNIIPTSSISSSSDENDDVTASAGGSERTGVTDNSSNNNSGDGGPAIPPLANFDRSEYTKLETFLQSLEHIHGEIKAAASEWMDIGIT